VSPHLANVQKGIKMIQYINLGLAIINLAISIYKAGKYGGGWWSAVFGWSFASLAQLQIVLAG
ncbi:MAG: hypothetical protein J0M11_03700, partial [Anaerolineae bacterium]|nr:hypothetical protein [Anaerolineae bacterium]